MLGAVSVVRPRLTRRPPVPRRVRRPVVSLRRHGAEWPARRRPISTIPAPRCVRPSRARVGDNRRAPGAARAAPTPTRDIPRPLYDETPTAAGGHRTGSRKPAAMSTVPRSPLPGRPAPAVDLRKAFAEAVGTRQAPTAVRRRRGSQAGIRRRALRRRPAHVGSAGAHGEGRTRGAANCSVSPCIGCVSGKRQSSNSRPSVSWPVRPSRSCTRRRVPSTEAMERRRRTVARGARLFAVR